MHRPFYCALTSRLACLGKIASRSRPANGYRCTSNRRQQRRTKGMRRARARRIPGFPFTGNVIRSEWLPAEADACRCTVFATGNCAGERHAGAIADRSTIAHGKRTLATLHADADAQVVGAG